MAIKLDKKQKTILVITVLAFGFLAWQIYDLVASDIVSTVPTKKARPNRNKRVKKVVKKAPKRPSKSDSFTKLSSNTSEINTDRSEYLQMANEYELAKMQSQLLKKQLQIATTKQHIQKLISETTGGGIANQTNLASTNGLQLSYVSHVNNVWTATIVDNGQYRVVHVGSTMPSGSVINAIDKKGVIYRQSGRTKQLTFNGVVVLSHPFQLNRKAKESQGLTKGESAVKRLAKGVKAVARKEKHVLKETAFKALEAFKILTAKKQTEKNVMSAKSQVAQKSSQKKNKPVDAQHKRAALTRQSISALRAKAMAKKEITKHTKKKQTSTVS